MKKRNVRFSGFMAAILLSAGAANAATLVTTDYGNRTYATKEALDQKADKTYVDEQVDGLDGRIEDIVSEGIGADLENYLTKDDAKKTYATQESVTAGLAGKLGTGDTAARATADAAGNVITDTYATKGELDGYATDGDIAAATSDMLTKTEAGTTYATKTELAGKASTSDVEELGTAVGALETVVGDESDGLVADVASAAAAAATAAGDASAAKQTAEAAQTTASQVQSAVETLSGRVDTNADNITTLQGQMATKADASVLSKYATTETLGDYLTTESAADTYATKESLAGKADTSELSKYATTESLGDYLTTESAADTYATKESLAGYATTDSLSGYATTAALDAKENANNKAKTINDGNRSSETAFPTVGAITQWTEERINELSDTGLPVNPDNIGNNAIEEKHIADGAITTGKIADGAVTETKLSEELNAEIDGKEDKSNKVQALTNSDTEYPSTAAVTTALADYAKRLLCLDMRQPNRWANMPRPQMLHLRYLRRLMGC